VEATRTRPLTRRRLGALVAAIVALYSLSIVLWLPFLLPFLVQAGPPWVVAAYNAVYAHVPPLALVPLALVPLALVPLALVPLALGGVMLAARLRGRVSAGVRAARGAGALVGLGALVCIATVFYALIVLMLSFLTLVPAG